MSVGDNDDLYRLTSFPLSYSLRCSTDVETAQSSMKSHLFLIKLSLTVALVLFFNQWTHTAALAYTRCGYLRCVPFLVEAVVDEVVAVGGRYSLRDSSERIWCSMSSEL